MDVTRLIGDPETRASAGTLQVDRSRWRRLLPPRHPFPPQWIVPSRPIPNDGGKTFQADGSKDTAPCHVKQMEAMTAARDGW